MCAVIPLTVRSRASFCLFSGRQSQAHPAVMPAVPKAFAAFGPIFLIFHILCGTNIKNC